MAFTKEVQDIGVQEINAGRGPSARPDRSAGTLAEGLARGLGVVAEKAAEKKQIETQEGIRAQLEAEGGEIAHATEEFRGAQAHLEKEGKALTNEAVLAEVPDEIKGTLGFKLVRARLRQGKIDQNAATIAVSSRIKELISKNPQFSKEIRAEAARLLNYDPAAEFKWRISDPAAPKSAPETAYEKFKREQGQMLADGKISQKQYESRISNYVELEGIKKRTELRQQKATETGQNYTEALQGIDDEIQVQFNQRIADIAGRMDKLGPNISLQDQEAFTKEVTDWLDEIALNEQKIVSASARKGNPVPQELLDKREEEMKELREAAVFMIGRGQLKEFLDGATDIADGQATLFFHKYFPLQYTAAKAGMGPDFIRTLHANKKLKPMLIKNSPYFQGMPASEVNKLSNADMLPILYREFQSSMGRIQSGQATIADKNMAIAASTDPEVYKNMTPEQQNAVDAIELEEMMKAGRQIESAEKLAKIEQPNDAQFAHFDRRDASVGESMRSQLDEALEQIGPALWRKDASIVVGEDLSTTIDYKPSNPRAKRGREIVTPDSESIKDWQIMMGNPAFAKRSHFKDFNGLQKDLQQYVNERVVQLREEWQAEQDKETVSQTPLARRRERGEAQVESQGLAARNRQTQQEEQVAEEPVAGGGEAIDITKGAEQVTLEGEAPEVAERNNLFAREFWEMLNRGDRHPFFNTIDPTKKDGEIVPVKNKRTGDIFNFKFMGGVPVEVNGRRFR